MIYLLDTNTISDWMEYHPVVTRHLENHLTEAHRLIICPPVRYELEKGLFWRGSSRKMTFLRQQVLTLLDWEDIENVDWLQAAQFWANARKVGKQLDDNDCLIAAIAHRLNAVIASSDGDFDPLPIKRENWRES